MFSDPQFWVAVAFVAFIAAIKATNATATQN
jgi:hypothetical protein